MKTYKAHFISRHQNHASRDVYLTFQIDTFEHLTPRLNKALSQLDKLPNPLSYGPFSIDNISEVEK